MVQFNPELAKSTPSDVLPSTSSARPGSLYSETPTRNASIGSRRSLYNIDSIDTSAPDDENDEEIQANLLRSRHDTKAARHLGRAKTLELLSRDYWWPSMTKFVN